MPKHHFLLSILPRFPLFAFVLSAAIAVSAQQSAPDDSDSAVKNGQTENRPSLVRQLELTPEQIRQIRRINQETRENLKTAAVRQRDAKRALDAAIYADSPSESEVEQRSRELSEAQTETTKLRAKTEFRIRQVLNSEQLVRFRELRERAAQKRNQPRGSQRFPKIRPNQDRQKRRLPLRRAF